MINYSDCSLCHHSSMSWWSAEGGTHFLLGKGWTHWTLRFSPQKSSLEISLEQCPWSTFILGASTSLTSLPWRRRGRRKYSILSGNFFPWALFFLYLLYPGVPEFCSLFWGEGTTIFKLLHLGLVHHSECHSYYILVPWLQHHVTKGRAN